MYRSRCESGLPEVFSTWVRYCPLARAMACVASQRVDEREVAVLVREGKRRKELELACAHTGESQSTLSAVVTKA